MSYPIDQPTHVGECATCGKVQELATCEDCERNAENAKAPYIAFWAALAGDAELQRSFDYETQVFDSGHCVCFHNGAYTVGNPTDITSTSIIWRKPLAQAIQWCIENREELI